MSKLLQIILTGTLLFSFLLADSLGASQGNNPGKTPDVSLKNTAGESAPLGSYIGSKPLLLVFWASWCAECRSEVPLLSKLDKERFKVIAVNEGESAWKTKRFVSTNSVTYQVALDADGSIAKAFQVPGVPGCIIIDKSGQIVYRGTGVPENMADYAAK
ncbi:MAG: TlpA family protein disulfide reductase [Geobacteraceae bacterium]|nr:TlpA family protein disulfide reductase [Geobacteraceae bacterium]